MGWLKDLDGAIQARLEAMDAEGRRLFRTIGPLRAQGRSPVPAEMLSADKPALFYTIERIGGDGADIVARVQALVVAEGLRGAAATWRGGLEGAGAYDLAETAARALVPPDLAGTAGAWLSLQRLACADGRVIALHQEYEVPAAGEPVVLDGQDLLGARSVVRLRQTVAAVRWQAQPQAGGEAYWATWQGRQPTRIVLAGTLWAGDEAGLAQIEQGLEGLLMDRQLRGLRVGARAAWPDIALTGWQRTSGRTARPVLGLVGQAVQIEFEQFLQ